MMLMQMALRVVVGVIGLLGVLIAARMWMAPAEAAGQLGIAAQGPLGIASIRADMAGFFGGAGLLALLAAVRNRSALLLAPLLLIAIALSGRLLTVAQNGYTEDMAVPIAVEAVLLAVFAVGRIRLAR
jgi:hypothetical protein